MELLSFDYLDYTEVQATTGLAEMTVLADFRGLTVFPLNTSFTVLSFKDELENIGVPLNFQTRFSLTSD